MKILVHHESDADKYAELLSEEVKGHTILVSTSEEQAWKAIRDVEVLFCSVNFPVHVLKDASNLQWIQIMGAGIDNFAQHARWIPDDVIVTRVLCRFPEYISEYVACAVFYRCKHLRQIISNQRHRYWKKVLPDLAIDKSVGVIGMGNIGAAVARKLSDLGMRVFGYDVNLSCAHSTEHIYGKGELSPLLARSDFVVLTLPLTADTRNIIGEAQLSSMKESAYLINVARGALIDDQALINALHSGQIAGAMLDVFREEPLPETDPMWDVPGLTITPHVSGPSIPAEVVEEFLVNLGRFCSGKSLLNLVDVERGY